MQVGDTKLLTGSLLLNYYATCIVHEYFVYVKVVWCCFSKSTIRV